MRSVFSDKTKQDLIRWLDVMKPKYENEENEIDPLIVIEWSETGLTQRGIQKAAVIAGMFKGIITML